MYQLCVLSATLLVVVDAALVNLNQYRDVITGIHNYCRRNENAANMKKMEWDPYLQQKAERWAVNCRWEHQYGKFGENLAMFWTTGRDMPIIDVIRKSAQGWWDEKLQWQFDTSCGSACHYTQMIWAETSKIGCGLNKCGRMEGQDVSGAQFFVCFYDPPGNMMGRYPYIRGRKCSRCDRGEFCDNGLCAKRRGVRRRHPIHRRNSNAIPTVRRNEMYRRNTISSRPVRRTFRRIRPASNSYTIRPASRYIRRVSPATSSSRRVYRTNNVAFRPFQQNLRGNNVAVRTVQLVENGYSGAGNYFQRESSGREVKTEVGDVGEVGEDPPEII